MQQQRPWIIAGMATMPSRSDTAHQALRSILPQVDRLYLFMDGFEGSPTKTNSRIVALRSQDFGDLHADGKMLGLMHAPPGSVYFACDDDILYPSDYVATMCAHLERFGPRAVVGAHANILPARVTSYLNNRQCAPFWAELTTAREVDDLGTNSVAFAADQVRFDVRRWPSRNTVDLNFALECEQRGVRRVAVPRQRHWLRALAENQPDSIYRGLQRDDRRHTRLARQLMERRASRTDTERT